jgi:beta-lactamase regulating signal transducer with metallopeptidase domain
MLLILLKSSACLAVFMLFYKLCLEKTSAHLFKRIYLIAVILISISIPFIVFTEYIEANSVHIAITQEFDVSEGINNLESNVILNNTSTIIWSIYEIGVILFSFRFIKNLYQIFQKIKANPKYKTQNYINVLLQDLIHPHTFFNYIFLNKNKFENKQIPPEVILHEQVHANQKHTIDLLFIELLQVAFWFNPLLHLIKKDIKLNHEFLADQAVINQGVSTKHYQKLLLAFSSNALHNPMANAINYSLIKKRFTVMKTKTSKPVIWLRSLIILPMLAFLIFSFSSKQYIEHNNSPNELIIQKKATPKQIAEYNALAKKYNMQPEDQRIIILKDANLLEYLYNLMSEKQKVNAEPFPNCPPPPPIPPKAKKGGISNMPPPPTPPVVKKDEFSDIPPPPQPKAPFDFVIEMAKKNATFYYNGNKISSDKAIALLKNNNKLNISSKTKNGVSVIKIQSDPITIPD